MPLNAASQWLRLAFVWRNDGCPCWTPAQICVWLICLGTVWFYHRFLWHGQHKLAELLVPVTRDWFISFFCQWLIRCHKSGVGKHTTTLPIPSANWSVSVKITFQKSQHAVICNQESIHLSFSCSAFMIKSYNYWFKETEWTMVAFKTNLDSVLLMISGSLKDTSAAVM